MGTDRVLTHKEVWAIQDALIKVVGVGAPGTWHAGEALWWTMKVGQVLEVPGIGELQVVDFQDQVGDLSDWSQPIYYVLKFGDLHFQVIGKNKSHEGSEWEYYQFRQVQGVPVYRMEWTHADS